MMTEDEWATIGTPGQLPDAFFQAASPRKLRLFIVACCRRLWPHLLPAMRGVVEVGERYADGAANDDEAQAARLAAFPDDYGPREVVIWQPGMWPQYDPRLVELIIERNGGRPDAIGRLLEIATQRTIEYPNLPIEQIAPDAELIYESLNNAVDWVAAASGPEGSREELWELAAGISPDTAAAAALIDTTGSGAEACDSYEARVDTELAAQVPLLRDLFGRPADLISLDRDWLTPVVVGLARGIYDNWAFDRLPILADALQDAGCVDERVLAHCRGPGPHTRGCWVVDWVLSMG